MTATETGIALVLGVIGYFLRMVHVEHRETKIKTDKNENDLAVHKAETRAEIKAIRENNQLQFEQISDSFKKLDKSLEEIKQDNRRNFAEIKSEVQNLK